MTNTEGVPLQDPDRAAAKKRNTRDIGRLVAALVIVVLLVAFVIDNSQSVKVGFVFFSSTVPLIWVLLVTAVLGILADRLLVWRKRQSRRAAVREAAGE